MSGPDKHLPPIKRKIIRAPSKGGAQSHEASMEASVAGGSPTRTMMELIAHQPSSSGGDGELVEKQSRTEYTNLRSPWQDPLGEISLSGFSDIVNGPTNMSDVMAFVKRQGSNMSCGRETPLSLEQDSSQPTTSGPSEHFFQFILMASTSPAVPLKQESLTYLNQGMAYEIRCRKTGPDNTVRMFRSVVSLTFFDRRHLYHAKTLHEEWRKLNPGQKMIDVDVPWCVNAYQIKNVVGNQVEYLWDPTKPPSVYIKINCISTDFTTRKHGGEKGVPFKLVIDNYAHDGEGANSKKKIYSCYAQIRVFKTKGADRKNKTDAERAKTRLDKEKFQPAYDYTILTETFPLSDSEDAPNEPTEAESSRSSTQESESPRLALEASSCPTSSHKFSPDVSEPKSVRTHLPANASAKETQEWLHSNRFGPVIEKFRSFDGADLRRLAKEDLIQICGLSDGIRLFNLLMGGDLLVYFRKEDQTSNDMLLSCHGFMPTMFSVTVYTPLYLKSVTTESLLDEVCSFYSIPSSALNCSEGKICLKTNRGHLVKFTNEFLLRLSPGSCFTISKDEAVKAGKTTIRLVLHQNE